MKIASLREELLQTQYIEQLNKLDYFDTEDKTVQELKSILTKLRRIEQFKQINHDSSENAWFV